MDELGEPADRSGFFMPAEWEEHEQIWMGWPQRRDVWRDKALPGMQAFVQVRPHCANSQPNLLAVWQ